MMLGVLSCIVLCGCYGHVAGRLFNCFTGLVDVLLRGLG